MTATDLLSRLGLGPEGTPPSVLLTVAGHGVRVLVDQQGDLVHLRAIAALTADPPDGLDLAAGGLGTRGDTTVGVADHQAEGRRTLVGPSDGVLYDALHELAKATVSAVLAVDAVAGLQAEARPAPGPPAAATIATAPTTAPAAATGAGFWFYVDVPVALVAVGDPGRAVGTLQPGSWYEGHTVPGGWVETRDDRGTPGWAPVQSTHTA